MEACILTKGDDSSLPKLSKRRGFTPIMFPVRFCNTTLLRALRDYVVVIRLTVAAVWVAAVVIRDQRIRGKVRVPYPCQIVLGRDTRRRTVKEIHHLRNEGAIVISLTYLSSDQGVLLD